MSNIIKVSKGAKIKVQTTVSKLRVNPPSIDTAKDTGLNKAIAMAIIFGG